MEPDLESVPSRALGCYREELTRDIQTGGGESAPGEPERECSGARSQIEDPRARWEPAPPR